MIWMTCERRSECPFHFKIARVFIFARKCDQEGNEADQYHQTKYSESWLCRGIPDIFQGAPYCAVRDSARLTVFLFTVCTALLTMCCSRCEPHRALSQLESNVDCAHCACSWPKVYYDQFFHLIHVFF